MEVANLNDPHDLRVQELKDQFDIDQTSGVLVLAVTPGTPADRARVRAGDVIVEIGESAIEGLTEYNLATERLRDQQSPITLLIRRGDLTSYVTIEPAGDGPERRSN
jgi:S1-C subfamily serine protease